jgi:hypothetical protein
MTFDFGRLFGAVAHNGLATLAGIALPAAANALQSLVTHSPYLATHPAVSLVAGIAAGAVTRDMLKSVPAFAASSGTATPNAAPAVT